MHLKILRPSGDMTCLIVTTEKDKARPPLTTNKTTTMIKLLSEAPINIISKYCFLLSGVS